MNATPTSDPDVPLLHILYYDALDADARLTETIQLHTGRTRWTLKAADYDIPDVRAAIRAKSRADAIWLDAMRDASATL